MILASCPRRGRFRWLGTLYHKPALRPLSKGDTFAAFPLYSIILRHSVVARMLIMLLSPFVDFCYYVILR